jgi:hypothetical protein
VPIGIVIAIVGLSVTLLGQFAGIIWFAATLRHIVTELKLAVVALQQLTNQMNVRVTLLEDREERQVRHTDVH